MASSQLFRGCRMEYCEHEQVVRNRVEGCDYYLVVSNFAELRLKSEDTTTVHKRRLQAGAYFVNRVGQHKKLVLLPGCTVLKIEAQLLLQRAITLKQTIELYKLMVNSLPTNKMDGRYIRPLSKVCVEKRLSKG